MVWALVGILLGIIVGLSVSVTIPIEYIKYTAVTIIGALDSLLGGFKAEITKEDEYNSTLFLSGLIFNIIAALAITFLGEKLGLDLYLAATVVFTFRIFANLGVIRRAVIDKLRKKIKKKLL